MKPSRRAAVPPFAVMSILNRVAELRAQGRDHLAVCWRAVPRSALGCSPPRRELMVDRTPLGYTETFGIKPLRREIIATISAGIRWTSTKIKLH
jgi:hypothetical protein